VCLLVVHALQLTELMSTYKTMEKEVEAKALENAQVLLDLESMRQHLKMQPCTSASTICEPEDDEHWHTHAHTRPSSF